MEKQDIKRRQRRAGLQVTTAAWDPGTSSAARASPAHTWPGAALLGCSCHGSDRPREEPLACSLSQAKQNLPGGGKQMAQTAPAAPDTPEDHKQEGQHDDP